MTLSDKLSWVGGMIGLFMGFSVISGVEILYWLFFKVIFHKRVNKVEEEPTEMKEKISELEKEIDDLKNWKNHVQLYVTGDQNKDPKVRKMFDVIFNDSKDSQKIEEK